ncbi:hypothetical protein FIV46_07305 [Emcibacter nanhaiensis]|uniref:Uncharacterized protein n=1 Tax=Emcibacter nanhaiensis TaxID=1505037 RepID=A0A501PPD0_9PROT|nr:hypothetical protein FIV46_07305 [Emcibacter nanhaiensis]
MIGVTIASRLSKMAERQEAEKQAELAALQPKPVEPAWAMTGGLTFPENVTVALEAGENVAAAQMVPQGLLLTIQRGGETTGLLLVSPDGTVRSRFTIIRPE